MIIRSLALFVLAATFARAQESPAPAPLWKKCGSEIAWMSDNRPLKDNNQGGALAKTEVDLENLWSDVKAKAREAKRPILWYIPKVAGSHMYRGAILNHYMDVSIWSDEGVVDLVGRRFVPFRAACAKELKDALETDLTEEAKKERFRLVEPAIVLLDADGRTLWQMQRIRTFNADFIAAALRSALDKHAPSAPPDGASGEELMKGGWFDAAAKKLDNAPLLLAELRRREGRFDDALAILVRAAAQGANADDVATRRGRTLLSMGKVGEARESLAKAATPEAAYYQGHAERMLSREDKAEALWKKLAESVPDSHWGWRAAANTTIHKDQKAYGPATVGFEDVLWSAAPAAGAATTRWELAPANLEEIARRAVAWLLRNRTSQGSWNDSRYAYWPSPEIQPNVHMAVTALACAALLEWRDVDPKGVEAALESGEAYLLDEGKMARGQNEESYADAYRLLYFSRKHAGLKDAGAKAKNVERMNAIAEKLAALQNKQGFWAHEYPNAFCTAAILQSLIRAQRAGAAVEDKVLKAGADALNRNRDASGRFGYDAARAGTRPFDSSGRNAMGQGALLELKATERAVFESAMEEFWSFLDRREKVRVCDFHSDGEMAGFFFFNNVLHTSEAFGLLEGAARDGANSKLAAHLAKIPEIDGSFIDSHEMGKSYGTAAALLSLKNCLKK